MAPRFTPAQTPTDFGFIPKSIDNIFDRFLQLQQGRRQKDKDAREQEVLDLARGKSLLETGGIDLAQVTPEIAQRAQQRATPAPGGLQVPGEGVLAPGGLSGLEEAVTRFMTQKKETRGLAIREREAGIAAKTRQGRPKPKTQQELDDAEEFSKNIGAITQATAEGRLPKGEVPARGSITSAKIKVLGRVLRDNPGISITDIRLKQAAALAETTTEARLETKAESETAFQAFAKDINPRLAKKSSLFGYAGRVNAQTDRAQKVIAPGKKITNQRMAAAVADFSAVMAAGRPNQIELEENGYDTIIARFAGLTQKITGKLQDAVPDEIVQEMRELLREVKLVDNDIIRGQLEFAKIKHELVTDKFPERSKRALDNIIKSIGDPGEEQQAQFTPEQARAELERRRRPGLGR